jgi:protocatechuate 3,4-dioxygenase, beta subunit
MKPIHQYFLVMILLCHSAACRGQASDDKQSRSNNANKYNNVGGPFENSEFMYIGMPDHMNSTDTSAGWNQQGQRLLITGTIFKRDGITPAPGIIVYYYHTDVHGDYANRGGLDRRVIRHGYIRGWVKSDENGRYAIYTVRPAPYPSANIPAHIHPAIKEPTMNEYYIDEFHFDDDKLLTSAVRRTFENRGGSGILRPRVKGDLQIAEHDIVLGLNIPNYPEVINAKKESGREVGEESPSFIPYHAFGPDKGTRTCPVCKYGEHHGILYFVGNKPNWAESKKWLTFLEHESVVRGKRLKVYFVYGNDINYAKDARQAELEQLGNELNDGESEVHLNKINPAVENTFVVFRQSNIVAKFIDLKPTAENFALIAQTIERTKSRYFDLTGSQHD